jgi:predicted SprT family Zn-dependent metalloprotease
VSFSIRVFEVQQLARGLFADHGLEGWSFGFNRRKLQMGVCLYGPRQIALSIHFVELNDDGAVRDTLLHEIAHALVGPGHGHDAVWRAKCREIGARPERLGWDVTMPTGPWQAVCGNCGRLHHRHRKPKHMVGWHCAYCGRDPAASFFSLARRAAPVRQ